MPEEFANQSVEKRLDELVDAIEVQMDADVLSHVGSIYYGTDDFIREFVESRSPKRDRLAVILETTGGYIEVVQRIADTFRHHYKFVEFVVPNYAMSAGTVLVMSGDAIHMDYYSVLSPIDPQIERDFPDGRRFVPAVSYLKKYDELIEKSRKKELTTAEIAFLVEKFDPAELHAFEQARQLSITLLTDWLARYKFKDWNKTETRGVPVTPEMKIDRAEAIAKKLNDIDRWHVHGRGISMQVLREDLGLLIDDFGKNRELNDAIKGYYNPMKDYMSVRGVQGSLHAKGRYMPLWG